MDVMRAVADIVSYAASRDLIENADIMWARNQVLQEIGHPGIGMFEDGPALDSSSALAGFDLDATLDALAEVAVSCGVVEDTAGGRDRAAMRVMGVLTPRPSEVSRTFTELLAKDCRIAADYLYQLGIDTNYVRSSAIARDIRWNCPSPWGEIEISINKSKPEKDPRDIAAAGAAPTGDVYPACQLCMENEGYAGRAAGDAGGPHPARQNLRIVPIDLDGETWGFQYSPYAYFDRHCIAMSREHRPMLVDRSNFARLYDFVAIFPHYFIGSNADLPVVGGSILSHDHFQGGMHVFPMMRAPMEEPVTLTGFEGVEACTVRWPMSVIRLASTDRERLLDAATYVLDEWREWSDESVDVVAYTGDTPHNTITPICYRSGEKTVLDLALRCNVATPEHPMGLFHPHEDKWHVKKENIGLIEVMGLAILPPRLEADLESGARTREGIGRVFTGVLEDAGVFKWDEAGRAAFRRFTDSL